jgi:hypothetical protein
MAGEHVFKKPNPPTCTWYEMFMRGYP